MNLHSLTQKEAAALLSTTPRSLRDWEAAQEGIPRNEDGTYPGPSLVAWYVSRETGEKLDANRERARKDKEMADKLALENALTRGDVVRLSVLEPELSMVISDHRANALALPSKVAPLLEGLNVQQRRDRLEDAVHELLHDLSTYRPGRRTQERPRDDLPSAEGSDAAAETDGEPVGRSKQAPKSGKQRRTRRVEN